ncbi:MAG: hypothetical protein DRQ51_00815 [Gammaproteobacteria bacterium]|nr:MAG: hypothetical protein DRQ51_00815 [Gammaproteobacteria bacterium]
MPFLKNPNIFKEGDVTVTLGVGKNIVSSIKHWLQATTYHHYILVI